MNNNFLKKRSIIIIIIIICIIIITTIIFLYRKSKNNNDKQKLELPILEQKNQEPIKEQNKESSFESIHNSKTKETGLNTTESPLKETVKVQLPGSSNFQKTFTEWCNTNNYNNLPMINKNEINETIKIESNYFNAHLNKKQTDLLIETENKRIQIIHVEAPLPAQQFEEYLKQLGTWMSNCDYKPNTSYHQHLVRDLLGRSSRTLYGITDISYYYYKSGIFTDDWSIDGQKINGSYYASSKYLDRNPAPKKPDGLIIDEIKNYPYEIFKSKGSIENKKLIKRTFYQPDGQTIKFISINEYNKNNQIIKITYYYPNGTTINFIENYDTNNKVTKTTYYHPDGTIKE